MMTLRITSTWWRASICIVASVLVGCGVPPPKGKISALAESARAISEAAATTYPRIQELQVEAKAAELMTTDRVTPAAYELTVVSSCQPSPASASPDVDKRAADALSHRRGAPESRALTTAPPAPAIGPRLHCIEDKLAVVVSYLELLDTFASADYGADVDKAAEKLSGSVAGIKKDDKQLAGAAGVLATIVDVVGRQIVECKRRNALVEAMDKAQTPLATIVGLIAGENDLIRSAAVDQYRGQIADNWLQVRNNPKYPLDARRSLDQLIASRTAEARTIDGSLESMSAALRALPEAHAEVRDEITNGKSTAFEKLHLLVAEGQRIARFHSELKKND